jgi:hypothetical protein
VGCQFTCLSLIKPKREKLNYRINKEGKLALAFKATPGKVNKPKKKAQVDERELMLAGCTVQRFAGCSVPSNYSL